MTEFSEHIRVTDDAKEALDDLKRRENEPYGVAVERLIERCSDSTDAQLAD